MLSNRRADLKGKVFGRWTVVGFSKVWNDRVYWKCRCECGTVRDVWSVGLMHKGSQSCGCLIERSPEQMARVRSCRKDGGGGKGKRFIIRRGRLVTKSWKEFSLSVFLNNS